MAKAVAKRKLRESYYTKNKIKDDVTSEYSNIKNISMAAFDTDNINGLYKRNGANKNHVKTKKYKKDNNTVNYIEKIKEKFILRFAVQSFTICAIFIFCIAVKYLDLKVVKNSEICKNVVKEFKTNYSKEEILENASNIWDKVYIYIDPIIPDKLSQKTVAVFGNIFKKAQDIDNQNVNDSIYKEEQVNIYSEPILESSNIIKHEVTVVPTVSEETIKEDDYVGLIKASGIEFAKPTVGVLTSHFGEREPIFQNVDSYHYGTDIANKIGTPIYSSIDGEVTVCSYLNETGNYIEVKNGNISTRYCHLSKQNVKVGDKVKKGDKIGEMGDTGMVTGPHLHFEIMYERNRVDAEQILSLS